MTDQRAISEVVSRPPATALSPLKHRVFRAFWAASLISNLGGYIQSVGAAWLMTSIAPAAGTVALVNSATTLPILLLAILAGAFADIHDRRLVMLAAQSLMLLASVALAFVTWAGWITPGSLLGLTALIGCGAAMNAPAWQASVGEQVPRADLSGAVALNSLQANVARSVGPAIGGAVVALAGPAAAFLLNAGSYFALLIVLLRWKRDMPARLLPPERLGSAVRTGLQYVWNSPSVLGLLIRALTFGVSGSAVWALMPLLARDGLGQGASVYGFLLAAFGVGAVLGAASNTVLRHRLGDETMIRSGLIGFAAAVAVAGFTPGLELTLAALLATGFSWVTVVATLNINVQMAAPRWVVGRAMSLFQMATFGGMALGSWVFGKTAEHWGLEMALCSSAAAVVSTLALAARWPLSRAPALEDFDPARPALTPVVADPFNPGRDAVVVTVEYDIPRDSIDLFLSLMVDKRQIRQRNGARRWRLLQDAARPELWLERFQSPSWTEHLRQRHRMTQAELAVEMHIRTLHQGAEPPVVRRLMERALEPWAIGAPPPVPTPGDPTAP